MADEKISALDAKTTVADTDLFVFMDEEATPDKTKKITGAHIKAAMVVGHKDLTTDVHGVGTGTIAKISTANKTIYIDKGASGANDGTSWTDAFESWADCKAYLIGYLIAHDWTIKVRYNATPYRETFDLDGFKVWGTLTIEGEYYWQGDCDDQNNAGEIYDASADFTDVEVGDKVYCVGFDEDGAKEAEEYEVCTVDDISQVASHIVRTDGTKVFDWDATQHWKYVIVRTEISGSDDGTDGGTARNNCFQLTSLDNVTLVGFYLTFSDSFAVATSNSRSIIINYFIWENCDRSIDAGYKSSVACSYCYLFGNQNYAGRIHSYSYLLLESCSVNNPGIIGIYIETVSAHDFFRSYIDSASTGFWLERLSWAMIWLATISANTTTGIYARFNSSCRITSTTNNATAPVDPIGTSEGAYIG